MCINYSNVHYLEAIIIILLLHCDFVDFYFFDLINEYEDNKNKRAHGKNEAKQLNDEAMVVM